METKICKCCGKELPITEFAVRGIRGMKGERKVTDFCKSCMAEKVASGRNKAMNNVRVMRLRDFTPRELMEELKRRGYEGKLTYVETHTIDLSTI